MSFIQRTKRALGITAGILLSAFMFSAEVSAAFKDVPSTQSGAAEINYLHEKGVIQGYGDGTFGPEKKVTRQQAVTMLARALNWQVSSNKKIFSDVPVTNSANVYIVEAVKHGVINGYGDGRFGPNDPLTRSQMAAILQKALKINPQFTVAFKDVNSSHWAKNAIAAVASNGVAVGNTDGTFHPNVNISRRHYSMMLARATNPNFVPNLSVQVNSSDGLNVRTSASASAKIAGKLANTTVVKLDPKTIQNGWGKITYNNLVGYVNLQYIKNYTLVTTAPISGKVSLPLSGKVIVLDPGHGGKDPGAVGNGLKEKEVSLKTALYTKDALTKLGATVYLTRSTDTYLTLEQRSEVAKAKKAGIFVSIHMNSSTSSTSDGTETYYNDQKYGGEVNPYPAESKKLATEIQKQLAALSTDDRGVQESAFYVLRENTVPSVLVELAFISNANDAKLLKNESFLKSAASLISQGIQNYYQKK